MTETQIGSIGDLTLELGGLLPDAKLAYVTYGRLAEDGRNAILLTHGYTSSHLFAEPGAASAEGSWSELVGPGRPIDTDTYFVVSSNMLGSSYGSTAPRSLDPASGRTYGPDFPPITLGDIVTAQRALLDRLGVQGLVAVIGPSYGGFQAFAWGIHFPDFMRGLVVAVSGLGSPSAADPDRLRRDLSAQPGWKGGRYDEDFAGPMAALRERTLRGYGIEAQLMERFPDPAARDSEIRRLSRAWAEAFDANSLLALGDAMVRFKPTPMLNRIKARVLLALSRTDALFPPSSAAAAMTALREAGVTATYVEIDSEHGHLASGMDAAKWAPALKAFLEELALS
jgi:homoserine O-acetyltransferase